MDTALEKRETAATQVEPTHGGRSYIPNVDILERENELLLVADVPGARADGVNIDYERGCLTLQADVAPRQDESRTNFLLQEYGVGHYSRTFQVGEGIDAHKITAEIADGVLTVHLPKAERLRPRKIEVKTQG